MKIISKTGANIALIGGDCSRAYSWDGLNKRILLAKKALSLMEIDEVAICTVNEGETIAWLIACIETNRSFCIISPKTESFRTKLALLNTKLVVKDSNIPDEDYYILFDTTLNKVHIGQHYSILNLLSFDLKWVNEKIQDGLNYVTVYQNKPGNWIAYDSYFENAMPVLRTIPIQNVINGVRKWNHINFNQNEIVHFDELINMQYDIVNGILSALSKGIPVSFSKRNVVKMKTVLYTSNDRLKIHLTNIMNSNPTSNVVMRFIKEFRTKKLLQKHLGFKFERIILSKRTDNNYLLNNLRCDITSLLVHPQVASYIAINDNYQINRTDGFCIEKDYFKILFDRVGEFGSLSANCIDYSEGRIPFDVGVYAKIEDGGSFKVLEGNKTLIQYHYGSLMEINKLTNYINRLILIKNTQLVCNKKGQLIMLAEPNVHVCDEYGYNQLKLQNFIFETQLKLNKMCNGKVFVKLELYSGKLDQQAYHTIQTIVNEE